MAEETCKIRYQIVADHRFPKAFVTECIKSTIEYKPSNDIFLSSYPRCGTTWTQQILYLIFHKGVPPKDGKDFMMFSPYMEMMGAEVAVRASRPCVLKVHLPFHLTPYSLESKYIYVTRNPKDCCVSLFYFITKTVQLCDMKFEEYFEYFINGEIPYGNYFDHVLSWYSHRNDSNVLFMTYEEIKRDFSAILKKLCMFLGGEYTKLIDDNEIMKNIFQFSSFDFMKMTTNTNLKDVQSPEKNKDLGGLNEVWRKRNESTDSQFVRKGEIGEWKNHFSSDQNERMNKLIQEKFSGTELLEIWKDIL